MFYALFIHFTPAGFAQICTSAQFGGEWRKGFAVENRMLLLVSRLTKTSFAGVRDQEDG